MHYLALHPVHDFRIAAEFVVTVTGVIALLVGLAIGHHLGKRRGRKLEREASR